MNIIFLSLILSLCSTMGYARSQIRCSGSATVAPLTQSIANVFVQTTHNFTPILISDGTDQGIQEFCANKGNFSPDLVNTSRPMKSRELETCFQNGVQNIKKLLIGKNGICLLHSRQKLVDHHMLALSLKPVHIFKALAKELTTPNGKLIANPYNNWNEIDPNLPKAPIQILMPPMKHGTKDVVSELILDPICIQVPKMEKLKIENHSQYKRICGTLRTDSVIRQLADYELAENANVLFDELRTSPLGTVAIVGCNLYVLHEKENAVEPLAINQVKPTPATLEDGTYPLIYSLQIYFNQDRFSLVKGLEDFLKFYASPKSIGPGGTLSKQGIIPMQSSETTTTDINPKNPKP